MRNVYVILPKAETLVSKIAGVVTGYPYSHITISLDDKLQVFYSFSRLRYNAPLISGFAKEYRSHLASKEKVWLKCKIFKIPVSEADYQKVKKFISQTGRDKTLLFNYLSMATMNIIGGFEVYKTMNCLSYAGAVLEQISFLQLPKPGVRMFPEDFDRWLSKDYFFFEGLMNTNFEYEDDRYFENIPLMRRCYISGYLVKEYLYRLCFKRVSKNYNRNIKDL